MQLPHPIPPDVIARIQRHTTKSDGCWIVDFKYCEDGYPMVACFGGAAKAAKVVLAFYCGPLDLSDQALHTCNNRRCVRYDRNHLYRGTYEQNNRDKALAGSLKGSRNGMAKIDEVAVGDIRARPHTPRVVSQLAAEYNLSKVQVRNIRKGVSWTHVVI